MLSIQYGSSTSAQVCVFGLTGINNSYDSVFVDLEDIPKLIHTLRDIRTMPQSEFADLIFSLEEDTLIEEAPSC